MRQALRLVVAIADYPAKNPGETVVLASKTRAQINKVLFSKNPHEEVEEGDF